MDGVERETKDTGVQGGVELPTTRSETLAGPASFLIGVLAIAFMFAMDFLTNDLRSLPFVRDRLPIAPSELGRNHDRLVAITAIIIVAGALAALFFLSWQFRAQADVRALRPGSLRLSPIAAVATWFVPLANLVLPFLAIRALWRASDPDFDPEDPRPPRMSFAFWLWWLSWIVAALLFLFAFAPVISGTPTASQLITRDRFAIAACAAGIAAAILGISVMQIERGRLMLLEDRLRHPDWKGWTHRR